MGRSRSTPTLLVVLALFSCPFTNAQTTGRQELQSLGGAFRIAGHVVNAKTGSPLARARVSITDARNPQRFLSTLTDEGGRFDFDTVPAGKFALEAAKRGFIRAAYDQHDQFSTAIVTAADFETQNLTLRLDPVAILTGRVLDESGDPVRHATVTVYREDHFSGVSRIRRFRTAESDDLGAYEATPLDAGTYFVSVSAKPWYEVHPLKSQPAGLENFPTSVDRSLDVAYPTTYYAGTTQSDEATPIPVRGGDRIEVDIHLSPVPALHLLMQAPNDRTLGPTMPILQESTFDGSEQAVSASLQGVSEGLYEVTGIPAGRYSARFQQNGQVGPPTPLELTSDGQELAAPSQSEGWVSLKAIVKILHESTLPSQLVVVLRDKKGKTVVGREVDTRGQVDLDPVAPGQYEVLAFASQNAYSVVRISSQGSEVSGHTLNVTAGSPMAVTLTLVGGVVNLEGFARQGSKAAPGVMIALVPKDPENNRDLFRRDQSDLDGSFNLRNVIPGAYTVVAIENGWDLDWAQPSVIAHYAEHGQPIAINERSQGTVHLPDVVEVQPR